MHATQKLFNWYAAREDDYSSPIVRGMGRTNGRERARKRVLTDHEIRLLWAAAERAGSFGAFLQIALLTAQRRGKVAGMRWDQLRDGTWIIETDAREKVNAGELKLPSLALKILETLPQVANNPFVFPGRAGKAIAGFSPLKTQVDCVMLELNENKAIPPWVTHDLRRTAKSLMARAGVRPDISERVLGHVISGVEGVYDRHDYTDEKAEALMRLADIVEAILNPPPLNLART